jgi:hypothetical protein
VVSNDGREIYASTQQFVAKVVDEGAGGTLVWTAALDPFEDLEADQTNFNLNLITAAANGLAFQAGAGLVANGTPLPAAVGAGVLDRETGAIRSFVVGGEETVAVMSVGPDGAMYLGNSPVRRLFPYVLGLSPAPIRGGISKFAPERLDLLARDAACAGETRARNAEANHAVCPEAARADVTQVRELIAQARRAGTLAVADGDLGTRQASRVERRLRRTDERLASLGAEAPPRALARGLLRAARQLARACRALSSAG